MIFPQMAQQHQQVFGLSADVMKTAHYYGILMLIKDCVQGPNKTNLGDFHGLNAAEGLHDPLWVKQIL